MMNMLKAVLLVLALVVVSVESFGGYRTTPKTLTLELLDHYDLGGDLLAEYLTVDKSNAHVYSVEPETGTVMVFAIHADGKLEEVTSIDIGGLTGGTPNSISISPDASKVAVAVAGGDGEKGHICVFATGTYQLHNCADAGYGPDYVTYSPDGQYIVSADEGQPLDDLSFDPQGSITVAVADGSSATTFEFDTAVPAALLDKLIAEGAHLPFYDMGVPGVTPGSDLEPEYLVFSPDSKRVYVNNQEAAAFLQFDMETMEFVDGMVMKRTDYMKTMVDVNDRDGEVVYSNYPVTSLRQPDAMVVFTVGGHTYMATANEGDSKDYDVSEEGRLDDLEMCPDFDMSVFPELRLKVTMAKGFDETRQCYSEIVGYGGRGFTVYDTATMDEVFDSGDMMLHAMAEHMPHIFNGGTIDNMDKRSDDKGPEPESITFGEVDGMPYLFVGMERSNTIMMVSVSDPLEPTFESLGGVYDCSGETMGDGLVADPEAMVFIPADESPVANTPLLVVSGAYSGDITVFAVKHVDEVHYDVHNCDICLQCH